MNKRILILGGGFAGAYTALQLERRLAGVRDVEIVLAARENFVLFTPMLHEVAASDVAITDVVQPLRKMLRRTRVLIVDIESINLAAKRVHFVRSDLAHAFDLTYDHLVLALGTVPNFHRTPGIEEHALTMKTLGDAILLRNRLIEALDIADNHPDDAVRKAVLTVVLAGGGFAGVETAGAVNDLLRSAVHFYPNLREGMLRVVLVHPGEVVLPELSETLGRYAQTQLQRRGVEVRLTTGVTGYDGKELTLSDGTKINSRLVVWTAGITPSPLVSGLPCPMDRGRVLVNACMQVTQWPGVWSLGDCAAVPDSLNPGKYCPPTAQHATRQAVVLAANIVAELRGQALQPFRFKTLGLLAAIGHRAGVAEILGVKFSGLVAWVLWRTIYLSKLPGLQNKVRVALDWTFDLLFSKDIVELPTLRSPTMSEREEPVTGGTQKHESGTLEPSEKRQ
ncbi:MAG TPA: NAD(P)/FAD-dependent oxidoreductase [Candidatus Acidoferrum sp.]|nr:NAD(P)/FAD-dependent oxidoreductase [Candidatus Acidoferrum sp.]